MALPRWRHTEPQLKALGLEEMSSDGEREAGDSGGSQSDEESMRSASLVPGESQASSSEFSTDVRHGQDKGRDGQMGGCRGGQGLGLEGACRAAVHM